MVCDAIYVVMSVDISLNACKFEKRLIEDAIRIAYVRGMLHMRVVIGFIQFFAFQLRVSRLSTCWVDRGVIIEHLLWNCFMILGVCYGWKLMYTIDFMTDLKKIYKLMYRVIKQPVMLYLCWNH